jgi:arylsulfatase A-like enzyme
MRREFIHGVYGEPVRFFFRLRRGWPTVGLALAAGLLIADCLFVVGPYMAQFNVTSLWQLLIGALGLYLLLCVGLDFVVQLLAPARSSIWIRGGTILAVAVGLTMAGGEARSLPLLAVAGLFAALVLGRFSWPLAAVAAAIALYPAVKSPWPLEGSRESAPLHAATAPQVGPSFVVVVLDTVRADHTSAYGYSRDTTPNLARLSARGVRFERAYATGHWSLPSHASLFTGLLASRHGAHTEHLALALHHPTLAELLARHGYETANFTGNAWIGPGIGMTRGFQRNHESWRSYHVDIMLLGKRIYRALMAPDWDKGGAESVTGIRRWLAERDTTRPYLLFVNLYEPHGPYQHVPRAFRRRFTDPDLSLRALEAIGNRVMTATQNGNRLSAEDAAAGLDLLDGAIAASDAMLGEILELVGDDPVVVALSDHGELFGEHALFGHSNTLYEPLIRIPMVIAGRGISSGVVAEEVVSLVDVMPTLLALAGIQAPPVDGIDLRPLLHEGGRLERRRVRAEQFSPDTLAHGWTHHRPDEVEYLHARKQAVVSRDLKRIIAADGSDSGYDLRTDPGEERPFPGQETHLSAWVPEPEEGRAPPALDPVQSKMLEVLGYLQ